MANSRKANAATQGITDAQLVVLRHFHEYVENPDNNAIPPSLSDLAKLCNCSNPTISVYLGRLEKHGCLKRTQSRYRPYVLTADGRALVETKRKVKQVPVLVPAKATGKKPAVSVTA